jgi:hypothetical protein
MQKKLQFTAIVSILSSIVQANILCFLNLHIYRIANLYIVSTFVRLYKLVDLLVSNYLQLGKRGFQRHRSLVVALSLRIREVVSSIRSRAGRVKPKTFRIGSDCSFVKSTAFSSENHGSFGYDLKNENPVSQ